MSNIIHEKNPVLIRPRVCPRPRESRITIVIIQLLIIWVQIEMLLRYDMTDLQPRSNRWNDTPRLSFSRYRAPISVNETLMAERLYCLSRFFWGDVHSWWDVEVFDVVVLTIY